MDPSWVLPILRYQTSRKMWVNYSKLLHFSCGFGGFGVIFQGVNPAHLFRRGVSDRRHLRLPASKACWEAAETKIGAGAAFCKLGEFCKTKWDLMGGFMVVLCGFYGGFMGFNGILWWFYGGFMVVSWDLMGFYGGFMVVLWWFHGI